MEKNLASRKEALAHLRKDAKNIWPQTRHTNGGQAHTDRTGSLECRGSLSVNMSKLIFPETLPLHGQC